MNKRMMLFLCFTLSCSFLAGQHIYLSDLPERLADHPGFRELEAQKRQAWQKAEALLEEAGESGLSENLLFYLDLAVQDIYSARSAKIAGTLAKLAGRRDLKGVDAALLEDIEREMIEINAGLDALNRIYRYAGEKMEDFRIDTNRREVVEELRFYRIEPGQRVAELGAGDGAFAAVLAASIPGLTLFINEIDGSLLDEIAYHVSYNPVFRQGGSRFYPVWGTPLSTGLEGARLDALIVRNALHHFDEMDAMLSSILDSLSPRGRLHIKERFKDDCQVNCCHRLIQREELEEHLEAAGFSLAGEGETAGEDGSWTLLTFVPVPSKHGE